MANFVTTTTPVSRVEDIMYLLREPVEEEGLYNLSPAHKKARLQIDLTKSDVKKRLFTPR